MAFSITGPILWLLFSMWCVLKNKVLSKMPRNAVSLQGSTQEYRVWNFTSRAMNKYSICFSSRWKPLPAPSLNLARKNQ